MDLRDCFGEVLLVVEIFEMLLEMNLCYWLIGFGFLFLRKLVVKVELIWNKL